MAPSSAAASPNCSSVSSAASLSAHASPLFLCCSSGALQPLSLPPSPPCSFPPPPPSSSSSLDTSSSSSSPSMDPPSTSSLRRSLPTLSQIAHLDYRREKHDKKHDKHEKKHEKKPDKQHDTRRKKNEQLQQCKPQNHEEEQHYEEQEKRQQKQHNQNDDEECLRMQQQQQPQPRKPSQLERDVAELLRKDKHSGNELRTSPTTMTRFLQIAHKNDKHSSDEARKSPTSKLTSILQIAHKNDKHSGDEAHKSPTNKTSILQIAHKRDKNSGDEVRKSWELLKSGEVSSLIKQGFLERSPARRRHSPSKVSPLLEAPSPEPMMSPACSPFPKHANLLNSRVSAASPPLDKPRSSTLLDMLSNEPEFRPKTPISPAAHLPNAFSSNKSVPFLDRSRSAREPSVQNPQTTGSSNWVFSSSHPTDVKLTLHGKDGRLVSLDLHRLQLIEKSKYFSARLSDTWCKQQPSLPYVLAIPDCEDVEMYQETLHLLYCRDLKFKLMKCSVSRVLGILKVAALILFEACIVSCLEYLEAAPWAEEDEEKVRTVLGQLQLDSFVATDVLKRVNAEEVNGSEEILVKLLQMVTKGKDDKARREMKTLVSRMLRENVSQNRDCTDVSKDGLYRACMNCLDTLLLLFLQASKTDFMNQGSEDRGTLIAQIARQADNLQWLLEILLDRHMADDFVKIWAHQSDLATIHKQIATMVRFEVSRLTARLCIAIGKGQVLCPLDVRYMLLQTWLPPLVDDFGWMQRCCKGLDKNVVEDGISQTILTLPLKQQQSILLAWFDRFSNNGDDCPNLQKAFEVWWRRTFVRPCLED